MTKPLAVVVHLGRRQAMGEHARLRSWLLALEAAGYDTADIALRTEHGLPPAANGQLHVVTGATVPEALSWSVPGARAALSRMRPTVVIHLTLRAYHPKLESTGWATVLDFVDRLSASYRDRASRANMLPRLAYRALSSAHRRAEGRSRSVVTTAAGLTDASKLGAKWFPNVLHLADPPDVTTTHDVVFFGNMAYEPNVDALEWLSSVWPVVLDRRPGTTCLIGGANIGPAVTRLAAQNRWDVHGPYEDAVAFAARGRVAVAPMRHAAGIQNKVLEAAAADVPVVISHQAAGGFSAPPPGAVAHDGHELAAALVDALHSPRQPSGGRRWILEHFSAQAGARRIASLLPEAIS